MPPRKSRAAVVMAALVAVIGRTAAAGDRPGLLLHVTDGQREARAIVPAPRFHLGPGESLHPAIAPAFEAEWTGALKVLQGGRHWLWAEGAEVFVAGARVGPQGMALTAGPHPLRVRYRRARGARTVQLQWRSEHFATEPVPGEVLVHGPDEARAAEAEARFERGRALVEDLGCVGCHRSQSPGLAPRRGPRLDGIGERTNQRWLYHWLGDPAAFRPGAVMPTMLNEGERADVAAYLAGLGGPATPARRGPTASAQAGKVLLETVGCRTCHGTPGLALDGLGSKWNPAALARYLEDPSRVHPGGRMPSLLLTGSEAGAIAAALVASRNPAFEAPAPAGDARRGRRLVQERGCLACHSLKDPGLLPNDLRAPRFEALHPDRGCLARQTGDASGAKASPRFRFAPGDREALEAFVTAWRTRPDRTPAPTHELRRRVAQLSCTSCHTMDDLRPAAPPPESVPSLTLVGARLRADWVAQVLGGKRRVREFLELRMPHYDPDVSRPLAELLAKAAGVHPGAGHPASRVRTEAITRGHGLLGTNATRGGLGCIGCHGWGQHRALGESGPRLDASFARLRPEFFRRWMRDPARVVSGTSMPNYYAAFEPAEADAVVEVLWAAFSAGDRLPTPEGYTVGRAVAGSEERPLPAGEAVIVRGDLPEATPAAIAVGLPGKLSYCFDAGESRLRYAWQGGFVDLSGTLLRKTDRTTRLTPTAQLLGEVFYRSDTFPWRVGAPDRVPAHRFRGYRLVEGFPEFVYEIDGVEVRERLLPSRTPAGLRRTLTIARVDGPVWLLDARYPGDRLEVPRGAPAQVEVVMPAGGKP